MAGVRRADGHPRMSGFRRIALGALLYVVAGLVVTGVDPVSTTRPELGLWVVALPMLAASWACARAARRVRARARRAWSLLAVGTGLYGATTAAFGLASAATGQASELPRVSPFGAGWLGALAILLGAGVLVYYRLRPERGWQGMLDALALVVAVGLVAWDLALSPRVPEAHAAAIGVVVYSLGPVLAGVAFLGIGWIVARHGRSAPPWLAALGLAFGLLLAAQVAILLVVLHHGLGGAVGVGEALAGIATILSGFAFTTAGVLRTGAALRVWEPLPHSAPPPWSRTPPLVSAALLIGLLVPQEPVLGAVALAVLSLVALRLHQTLRITGTLLSERDMALATDSLTGAYSRAFFTQELARSVSRAVRVGRPLGLIAFDLDRFKLVNDRLGHLFGDELLRGVCRESAASLRTGDYLCRSGGDEFLVICSDASSDGTRAVAERLRAAVRRAADDACPEIGVTASFGVASVPEHAADPGTLLDVADRALYAAKEAGRDAVVVAPAPRPLETAPTPRG